MGLREENPQGFSIIIVCSIFAALATLGVAMRFRSRVMLNQTLVLSDYTIIVALILAYGNMAVLGLSVTAGMGRSMFDLQPEQIVQFVKCQIALSCIWIVTLTLVKVSILDLYIKLFRNPTFIKVVYAYMAIQIMWGLAGLLQLLLLCRPIPFNWDKTIPNGVCGSYPKAYLSAHIIILLLDLGTAILPIPILWKLQMATRKKVGISIMFSIGLVIGVFDLIRIAWRSKIDSQDVTEAYAILFMFSLLEPELGIFLACLPLCQPVMRQVAGSPIITWTRSRLNTSWTRSQTINTTKQHTGASGTGASKARTVTKDDFMRLAGDGESSRGLRYEAHGMADLEHGMGNETDAIHVKQSWRVDTHQKMSRG